MDEESEQVQCPGVGPVQVLDNHGCAPLDAERPKEVLEGGEQPGPVVDHVHATGWILGQGWDEGGQLGSHRGRAPSQCPVQGWATRPTGQC
jgi:hypothetical protein